MKILIADDDASTRLMLSALLTKFGHEIIECENGLQARDIMLGESPPPLALLDWVMPGCSGLELVQGIRDHSEHIPYLILLTSRGESQYKIEGLDAGADDYMVKPIEPGELRARIQAGIRILEMKQALDEKVEELETALHEIKTLHGLLPICSACKKIRNDEGYWEQIEVYIKHHSDAEFTHSLCPECLDKLYPELSKKN